MIKFLVFSDLNYDEMADGDKRLDELISVIKRNNLDFCVSLGDFCEPTESNKKVCDKIRSAGVQIHHVIGNHELDNHQLDDVLHFLSLEKPFYTFEYEDCKFIILNSCYWNRDEIDYSYFGKNYKEEGSTYPVISQRQIEWLRKEIADEKRHIIFSHHSLVNDFKDRGIYNRQIVRELFDEKNVILCMNGHDHGDELSIVNDIPYYTVNSASYIWVGWHIVSSEMLMKKYGYLHGIVPYKQVLYALVEIDESEIRIKGMDGEYKTITPNDLELYDYRWNGVSIKSKVSSYTFNL